MSPPLLSVEHLDVVLRRRRPGAARRLAGGRSAGSVVAVLGLQRRGQDLAAAGHLPGARRVRGRGHRRHRSATQGVDLAGLDTSAVVRRGLVQVPEGRRVFRDLTVEENLRAGGFTVRDTKARDEARDRVFDLFPILAERRDQPGGLLSGGQQQMLAMGRALMTSPKLLLLDEPSLGLAPLLVDQIGEIVTAINRQGTAVLLIEQNAVMGLRVADRAYVLEVGHVTAVGQRRRACRQRRRAGALPRRRRPGRARPTSSSPSRRSRPPSPPSGCRRGPDRAVRRRRRAVRGVASPSSRARCTRSSGRTEPASPRASTCWGAPTGPPRDGSRTAPRSSPRCPRTGRPGWAWPAPSRTSPWPSRTPSRTTCWSAGTG